MRRRSDGNQAKIIETLRKHGVSVACLSSVGSGLPDLLCGLEDGRNILLEVKCLSGRGLRLTEDEDRFFRSWKGACYVVFSPEQALEILGIEG